MTNTWDLNKKYSKKLDLGKQYNKYLNVEQKVRQKLKSHFKSHLPSYFVRNHETWFYGGCHLESNQFKSHNKYKLECKNKFKKYYYYFFVINLIFTSWPNFVRGLLLPLSSVCPSFEILSGSVLRNYT